MTREKFVWISGREMTATADTRPPREYWKVYVSNNDESDALYTYLPRMVTVAMESIARSRSGAHDLALGPACARLVVERNAASTAP